MGSDGWRFLGKHAIPVHAICMHVCARPCSCDVHQGFNGGGSYPSHPLGWTKQLFGWLDYIDITTDGTYTALQQETEKNQACAFVVGLGLMS